MCSHSCTPGRVPHRTPTDRRDRIAEKDIRRCATSGRYNASMPNEPEDKRGGSCASVAALALAAVVVAYPLSAGPVLWAANHGYLLQESEASIRALYWPLTRLYEHSQAFARIADWYVGFWQ